MKRGENPNSFPFFWNPVVLLTEQLRKTCKEKKGRGLVTFIYVIVEWEIQDIGRAVQLKAHVRKAEYCTVKMFYFLPTSAG